MLYKSKLDLNSYCMLYVLCCCQLVIICCNLHSPSGYQTVSNIIINMTIQEKMFLIIQYFASFTNSLFSWNFLITTNFYFACESFDINRENARVFCSPGFYLRDTTSLRKKEKMAMLRIKVCMNIIFIVSDIYANGVQNFFPEQCHLYNSGFV
jgi:hypothetical protein